MAWLESHQEIWRHPKTKKLARLLGVSIPTAVGHLHGLWYWSLDFAQDGNLSQYDVEDLADAALWIDDPTIFVDALATSGFVDRSDGGLYIHNWWDYAGRLIDRRKSDAERKRTSRSKSRESTDSPQDISRTPDGQTKDGERSPSLPYQTIPYQTIPYQTIPDITIPKGNNAPPGEYIAREKIDDEIEKFIDWYFEFYKSVEGYPHPYLKVEQKKRVIENLRTFLDNPDFATDYGVLQIMTEAFFDEVKDSDHNINHFATEGILKTRFYATL